MRRSILPLFLLLIVNCGAPLVAQTVPAITGPTRAGSIHVDGTAQVPNANYKTVKVYVCMASAAPAAAYDCSDAKAATTPAVLSGIASNSVAVNAKGTFGTTLDTALKSGDYVWLTEVATPSATGATDVVVLGAVQTVATAGAIPTITQPVKDQANPIVGTAIAGTTAAPVIVQLEIKDSGSGLWQPQGDPELVTSTGAYTLHETVSEGQMIHIVQSGAGVDASIANSAEVKVQALDNEREHIDFFAGSILSQGESNFSQADTFLALNVDRAFRLPGFYSPTVSQNHTPVNHTPGINTFFQVRLTTIPVNASQTTTTTTTTASTTPTLPSFSSVISSQKAGHFEAGFYMPYTFGAVPRLLTAKEKTGIFYVAPLFRFGFNTLAGSGNSSTSTSNSTAGTTTTTTTATALGTTNPLPTTYSFFVVGGRIGTAATGAGSLRNIHYLDIGVGKFSNMENLLCKGAPGSCPTTANEYRYRPYRLSFEGYYQIPTTGFILGMSTNVGPGIFDKRGNTDINNRAPGDLRFLFGYKFDAVKLFKALPMM